MESGFKVGDEVKCMYGIAVISGFRTEDAMYIANLTTWKLATGKSPLIYMPRSSFQSTAACPVIGVGDIVCTNYVTCSVKQIRLDGMHVLEPVRWLLANQKPPTFYMLKSALTLYQKLQDTPAYLYAASITKIYECKTEGGALFKAGDYIGARLKYWEALRSMETLGQSLNNEQKAEIFELTVNIHNNLSLCNMRTKEYGECILFAENVIKLIDALEARVGESSLVFQCLCQRGTVSSIEDMNRIWKKKAFFYAGKAELMRKNYGESIAYFERVLKITAGHPEYAKDEEDVKQLILQANSFKKQVCRTSLVFLSRSRIRR